jgi:Concanavalin A-like lectin/glucanases superfamily
VNVPDNDGVLNVGAGDFTVDLWVFFNDTSGEQILAEKYIQGDNIIIYSEGWTLTKLESNVLLLAMADGNEDWGVSSDILPIGAGTWTHFAATRLGSEITLFMNGVPVAQGESSLNLNSYSSLKFGHRGYPEDTPGSVDEGGYYLSGRIDEVHLFVGKALTHCQIQAIFNARKAGMCK